MKNAIYILLKSSASLLGIASVCISSGGALTWQAEETIDSPLPYSVGELLQKWDCNMPLFRTLIESSEPLEDDDNYF